MVDKLFTPVTIGDFTVQHRIVMAPLTRCRAHLTTQVPKEFVADYYAQRASCQGFIITEATSVHKDAAPFEGTPGIYSEEQILAWREVTERVHQNGGRIFTQIWHVGRTAHSSLLDGKQPVSSSAVKLFNSVLGKDKEALGRRKSEVPRVLRESEIRVIVNQFVTAAENAIRAGFDGVEVHAANGYLIDQFIRDGVNQRTDNYGGSIEKRCKLPLDIIGRIAEKLGNKRIGIRFSPFGTFNSMSDSDPITLFSYLFQKLNELYPDLAYIHLADFNLDQDQHNLDDNRIEIIRKVWQGRCIINLDRVTRQKAIEIINENKADLVAIGRDFISNPDLPKRFFDNLPLNEVDTTTFYTFGRKGYTDYPFYEYPKLEDTIECK